jgi:heat shock protein HtpX
MMRVALFLATNLAVVVLATLTLNVLGVGNYLERSGTGIDLTQLLIFSAVFGMAGSFISLLMSKWIAKMTTRAQVIGDPRSQTERWLKDTVAELATQAKIGMPEVAIFHSPQPNAFATGWNKNSSLVAVSSGLIENMRPEEVRAVLGHEIGHVANGDMVTLALIQGVVNTFVIFFARIIGYVVDRVVMKNEEGHGIGFWVTTMVAEIVLGLLATMIVMWFSRRREFRADHAGATLAGKSSMIAALERLKIATQMPNTMPDTLVAFGIAGGKRGGLRALYASHPPLDERIAALQRS